jgi:biotin carboxylase
MKRKLLIVGAGAYQHYIYKTARALGFWIGSVDGDGNAPMFELSDKSWNIDFSDTKSVIKIAKEEKIDAVATINIDQGMKSVEKIKEGLGLPHLEEKSVVAATRKDLMRDVWKRAGINQPKYRVYSKEQSGEALHFAENSEMNLIIKPVDNAAKRGISMLKGHSKLLKKKIEDAFKYSKIGKVIIEEVIEGDLIFAATYLFKDQSEDIVLLMKQQFNDNLVQLRFDAPLQFEDSVTLSIKSEALKAAGCFGSGPFHTEIIVTKENVPYLIETSPRVSYATVSLSKLIHGFDPVLQVLKDAVTYKISDENDKCLANKEKKYAILQHLTPVSGSKFNKASIPDIENEYLYEIVPVVEDGYEVKPLRTNEHRVLYFTVCANSKTKAVQEKNKIQKQLLNCFI